MGGASDLAAAHVLAWAKQSHAWSVLHNATFRMRIRYRLWGSRTTRFPLACPRLKSLMEMEIDNERAVWCIVATFKPAPTDGTRTATFEPGTKLYCFPPNVSGAYESIRVIGRERRGGKLGSALVAAHDLVDWRGEAVRNREVIREISPPWDASEVSRGVAKGVSAWKSGGEWPAAEIREWNRANAQTQVGPDTLLGRVRGMISKALGRTDR